MVRVTERIHIETESALFRDGSICPISLSDCVAAQQAARFPKVEEDISWEDF